DVGGRRAVRHRKIDSAWFSPYCPEPCGCPMILCELEIHKVIDQKRLVIEPEPLPRRHEPEKECPYGTHSVDLTLGDELLILKEGQFSWDLARPGNLAEFISRNSEKVRITPTQPYLLPPHQLVLGRTRD